MRRFAHWTPRYGVDKLRAMLHQWTHPKAPWLTAESVKILERFIKPTHLGAEWGAGRSTCWLAQRTAGLVAIEHDAAWHGRVARGLDSIPDHGVMLVRARAESPQYLEPIRSIEDGLLDFVIVDGVRRDECALVAIPKLRKGGALVVDDAHRYLPSDSRAPQSLTNEDTMTAEWKRFAKQTAQWERTWTSDGLRDTAIFWKA